MKLPQIVQDTPGTNDLGTSIKTVLPSCWNFLPGSSTGFEGNTSQNTHEGPGRFKEAPFTFLDMNQPQLKELM